MARTVPLARPHTAAILAALATTGRPVGDGEAPAGADLPYPVLYPIPGGVTDGPVSDPDADVNWIWQVTSVGSTREQCEWMADEARTALLATPVAVAGRHVVRLAVDMSGGAVRDDDVQPPVFYAVDRYRLHTTPANA